ncbi:multidrug transporter AcrB, partial [Halarcobacter bivalviorum]
VAMVDLKGEKREQFNIQVDINKLSSYNIALANVMKSIEALNYNTPNIATNTDDGKLVVMSIDQAIKSVKDLENLIISYNYQTPIYRGDIAKIEKSYEIQNKKDAYIYLKNESGNIEEYPQITLMASKLKGANSVVINEKIFEYMSSIK